MIVNAEAPARRRRGELSRPRILEAALRLVDQDGLEALTMRRLADELKVDPMSTYNHVDGKEALLDGLAELLWNEIEEPDPQEPWQGQLRAFAVSMRALAHAHPNAYGLLLGRGILPAPALERIGAALGALEQAGLSRERAAQLIRMLIAYAAGYAMLELSSAPAPCATPLELIVSLTRTLPKDAPAHLVEVAQSMVDCDMDLQFNLGLDLILSGLQASL
jgi:TetR/AcrR family tetracycline transcriptional repressor